MANLRSNPVVEVNVVDPIARKGHRFKGTATVLTDGALFEELLGFYEHGEARVRDARARIWPPISPSNLELGRPSGPVVLPDKVG